MIVARETGPAESISQACS